MNVSVDIRDADGHLLPQQTVSSRVSPPMCIKTRWQKRTNWWLKSFMTTAKR
jgi:hypothetical protein